MELLPKKLYKGIPTVAEQVLLTVPVGKTYILKNITMCNTAEVSGKFTLKNSGTSIVHNLDIVPTNTVSIDTSIVLEAGETINASQTVSGAINVTISGVMM